MSSYRLQRVSDEIKRIVADIFIRDLPHEGAGLITVTKVVCTSDLREARIYVSIYNQDKAVVEKTMQQIRHEATFIRGLVGHRLLLRFVPKLLFFYDDSQEYAEHIERLFQNIHKEETSESEEGNG